jgi:hypothetical protein
MTYNPKMKETVGVYDTFLDRKKNEVDRDFLKRLQNFHSGLSQRPNTNKIGQYKNVLDPETICLIETICGEKLVQFGYQVETTSFKKTSLVIEYYKVLAKCYRRSLLTIYFHIPLSMKLFIKKWNEKKQVV